MLRRFRSFLTARKPAAHRTGARQGDAPPMPEFPTYVVGDVHGRADLLELILELIDAHIGGTGGTDPRLVFVGDYVDHGPDSAGVLARMQELSREFPQNVVCLMGNHERMLLDFLDDPGLRGPRWLRAGGGATLQSFGIETEALTAPQIDPTAWQSAARALWIALGTDTRAWLAQRPLSWSSGNLWVVHAGADPQRAMDAQSARVLLWGHPEFDSAPRHDGLWIAHGHTEIAHPSCADGRIAVDTGAWQTGRLTACALQPDGTRNFLQT